MMQELNYIRCGNYYIPDIRLPEENRPIGRWGRMHRDYIKEHNPIRFNDLCLCGELWTYLDDLNEQAQTRLELIIQQMKPFFDGRFSGTALYILSHYQSPEKIANMNAKFYEALRKKSRGKFSVVKFAQQKTLAKNTVGRADDFLLKQMEITIDIENQLDAKINEITVHISACIRGLNPPILTIAGIGELTAAVTLSEYGDINRFGNPAQMLSFAGLEPGYYQSGQTEHGGHMVKHGSSHLRYALMNACLPLITYEPVFAEYYAKKRAEGKPRRVALTHVAKKPLRVIYTLQIKNISYDPTMIR